MDSAITEYLEATKMCYKDLVAVAKDPDTQEIKPLTLAFKIQAVSGAEYLKTGDHVQNFFYVLVDPQHWHVTLFNNYWSSGW